jgi:hypothetical protein
MVGGVRGGPARPGLLDRVRRLGGVSQQADSYTTTTHLTVALQNGTGHCASQSIVGTSLDKHLGTFVQA